MSVLYLHFESDERPARVARLARSGAHIVVSEPRWPGFFELAKKEKPYAIAVDFSAAPSHALETADYLAKAKETRDATFYLLRVPEDRMEIVRKRLPNAPVVSEQELSDRLAQAEREAQQRAREKKEAAAAARKSARAKRTAEKPAPAAKPLPSKKAASARKTVREPKKKTGSSERSRPGTKAVKKTSSRPPKKK